MRINMHKKRIIFVKIGTNSLAHSELAASFCVNVYTHSQIIIQTSEISSRFMRKIICRLDKVQ